MRPLHGFLASLCLFGAASVTSAQNSGQLAENGWYSDDTRADGIGANAAGTDLVSPTLTDGPEALAGNPAHDADILRQIAFGEAPGMVPANTHRGSVHLTIGPSAAGKSQISHRKDDGVGHADGADAFGPGMWLEYSWMGDGTVSNTASVKFGVQTAEFGMGGTSPRTGENDWDKVLIYEPGNLNGGVSNGTWFTETVDYNTGTWWFFDRVASAGTIGTPMTLAAMSTSTLTFSGSKTLADVYALITAPGAIVTSVQFGVGSGNAGASVHVNQLETNFYRAGSVTTFGTSMLACDQDVTSNVIVGSGIGNGSFTVDRNQGIELGLRGKLRFDSNNQPQNVFNSNGDGTYSFDAGSPTAGASWVASTTPFWSIEWSVNTDYDGSTGKKLSDLTYELSMDFDASVGTHSLVWDPMVAGVVLPFDVPVTQVYWDHGIGDNTTPQSGGTVATDATSYNALIAANNLAQNSWTPEFFNEAPFDTFDPSIPGRYDFHLAAFDGGVEVARTSIVILVHVVEEFDQDVTSNVIFGSGNVNGSFTTSRGSGVEIGLRGKVRFDENNQPQNSFNSNGDGTYTFEAGAPTGGASWVASTTPFWNIEWSVNTDFDGSSALVLSDLTYELGMDFDASSTATSLVFDPIALNSELPYTPPATVPFWDHAIGDNSTAAGAGTVAPDSATYAGLIASNNLAQNSWSLEFFNEVPFDGFDPNVPGRYDFYLAAFDGGAEVARSEIAVIVRGGTSLSLEAAPRQKDQDCNLAGTQIEVELWMRNLAQDATGYQAFLAFDPTKLSYEGAASSYTATPFSTHIQGIAGANVAPGELRLDGLVTIGSGASFGDDALLATLVFTVAAECDPTSVVFDLTQGFDSELSFQGSPLLTSLVDSSPILGDATPPILAPMADILVAADASSGCGSAVVNYTLPAATDSCGGVTVESYPPPGTAFPAGQTTTVTTVATDEAGLETIDTFDVTVTATNLVFVEVQLVGVSTAVSRCIRFVPNDCAEAIDVVLPFDATGYFAGTVEIPCGNWNSLCAKDEQHTLWGSTSLGLNMDGTAYVGGSTLELEGGDTDNDGDVDINDVTLFLFQFGQTASSGGCAWDGTRDADFDNNGAVGSSDYGFLTANWLETSACGCFGNLPSSGDGGRTPGSRLRVRERWQSTVDFNGDGWIDHEDVRIFEQRNGLPHSLSERMRR